MIETLSNKITSLIKGNLDEISDEKAEIINYGMQLIIYEIFVLIIIFALALISGLFKYVLISFVVYGSLRVFTGGAHARTRLECTTTYILTLFGAACRIIV